MNREEFEKELQSFEEQVRKRLPSMINISLANKGNREQETAFRHFLETLQRQRKVLLRYISRVARPTQRVRYFNTTYNMDSQLRSMTNRDTFREHLKFRHHRMETPVVYDIGVGPEPGEILNVSEDRLLIKTREKVHVDQELKVSISGKSARGKALWSITQDDGVVETGVRLMEISSELMDELNKCLDDITDKS